MEHERAIPPVPATKNGDSPVEGKSQTVTDTVRSDGPSINDVLDIFLSVSPPSPPIVTLFGQCPLAPQCGRNFWVVPKDDRVVPDAGGVRGYLRLFRRVFA